MRFLLRLLASVTFTLRFTASIHFGRWQKNASLLFMQDLPWVPNEFHLILLGLSGFRLSRFGF
jgi:hypothetical protein